MTATFRDPLIASEIAALLYLTMFWPALMWAVGGRMTQRQCVVLEFKPRGK